jgi:tetratricopeptide (TPR) repeat protein
MSTDPTQSIAHEGPDDELSAAIQALIRLVGSDPPAAENRARELLKDYPQEPGVLLLLAMTLRRKGNHAAARTILEPLVLNQPAMAAAHYELGMVQIALGRNREATRHIVQAVELDPNHVGAWNALGDQLTRMRRKRGADAAYAKAFEISVEDPKLRDAVAFLKQDKAEQAERLLREILVADPNHVTALKLMAELCLRAERFRAAETLLARCLQLAPDFIGARYRYATVLLLQNKLKLTLAQLDELSRQDPVETYYRNLRAVALTRMSDFEGAAAEYEAVLKNDPNQPGVWIAYGHALNVIGRRQEAIDAYRKPIALVPGHGEAYWSLANLKTFRFTASDMETMFANLQRPDLKGENRSYFHFALGKALEDEGRFEEAFDNYRAANNLLRSTITYNAEETSEHVRRAKAFFTREFFAKRSGLGYPATDPIFIVGLPRSGSTLIEQILASHSMIEGTSELRAIDYMAGRIGGRTRRADRAVNYPEVLAGLDAETIKGLGEEYVNRAKSYRRTARPYFIDKMPNNFLHLGFIHLIAPNAKIIDARRHPLGCCLSNYKQHFGPGQYFSYSLTDLGRYYSDYVELMAHFDDVLPGRVRRVIYEQLIEDPEAEIRRLLEHLGLPFEEPCLRFYETDRAVRTPSAQQVRMPIFKDGADSWKHFEAWLGPLKAALGSVLESYPAAPTFFGRLSTELTQSPANWGNEVWSAKPQWSKIAAGEA